MGMKINNPGNGNGSGNYYMGMGGNGNKKKTHSPTPLSQTRRWSINTVQTHVGRSIAFNWNIFLHFMTLRPWPLTSWPNIKWVAITHDVLYLGKFGDSSFSRFGSSVRTYRQMHRQTRMNALLPRLSSAWH